ncbi:MAG: hypothetical protein KF819_03285 [Labilithrix sp.]|nr:hypothetical protein [Labilithrix sp.]
MSRLSRRSALASAILGLALVAAPSRGEAQAAPVEAVPEGVLAGLHKHAAAFEQMKLRGAFTIAGHLEEVDGDGRASDVKDIVAKITPLPGNTVEPLTEVVRYTHNGKDKTDEAREKAAARRGKKKKVDKKDLHLPFLASEQGRYVFTLAERDATRPERVRIAFRPKEIAEDAIKGSAWVDTSAGEVLSIGFSLSKNPAFIDHVEITLVFGMATPLGKAPSRISFDGRGGFLFIRKHYRGSANLSEPRVAF